MADYIRASILCQAYVHAELNEEFEDSVAKIRDFALPLVQQRVSFFLYEEAQVSSEPSEGSIKSRITVMGTIFLALQGISHYRDFREGIILLNEDVHRVAEIAVSETLFALRARHGEVVRVEVRTGVVGSLRRIVGEIDRVSAETGEASIRQQNERLKILKEDVLSVIDNLNDSRDVGLVADGLHEMVSEIPRSPTPAPKERVAVDMVESYRRSRLELLQAIKKSGNQRQEDLQ